ncbi:MAG: D-2-hydroxyacid dehydrogenase [Gammaproteobacteria bacterium]|nr:D-2-hydroxyacid dehydrogenase [Gammaproteobacteria bacterium]
MKPVLVVQGASRIDEVPRLAELENDVEIRLATSTDELRAALPGAEAMLGWNFRADSLQQAWDCAGDLRWIHWGGAGVDAAMFAELKQSDIVLTNARGVFDQPMAEWVLGMILCFAKRFPQTLEFQAKHEWNYRLSESVAGKRALVVGVGSIGRAVGRLLQAAGMQVDAVGRSARDGGADFSQIHAIADLHAQLPMADYVVLITPLTADTRNLFGAAEFTAMAKHARFINIGRGALVVEEDLLQALRDGQIAGAALDVFVEEPLPADSPFWSAPNCLVSPHMSGDYFEFEAAMADQFMTNWARFIAAQPLINVVDKTLGFVPGGQG